MAKWEQIKLSGWQNVAWKIFIVLFCLILFVLLPTHDSYVNKKPLLEKAINFIILPSNFNLIKSEFHPNYLAGQAGSNPSFIYNTYKVNGTRQEIMEALLPVFKKAGFATNYHVDGPGKCHYDFNGSPLLAKIDVKFPSCNSETPDPKAQVDIVWIIASY